VNEKLYKKINLFWCMPWSFHVNSGCGHGLLLAKNLSFCWCCYARHRVVIYRHYLFADVDVEQWFVLLTDVFCSNDGAVEGNYVDNWQCIAELKGDSPDIQHQQTASSLAADKTSSRFISSAATAIPGPAWHWFWQVSQYNNARLTASFTESLRVA